MLHRGLLIVALTLSGAGIAQAQESDDELARNHFLAGRSYYSQSRFEEAVREFEEAYRLSPRPPLLLNISRAAERAEDLERAIEALEQYLAVTEDPPDQRAQQQRIQSLRARLEAARSPEPDGSPETDSAGAEETAAGIEPEETDESLSGLMVGGLASFGVALASVAVLGATGAMAEVHYTRLEEECGAGACTPNLASVRDEGETFATVSTAFTFVAIGTAILGGVLVLVDVLNGSSSSDAQTVRLGPEGNLEVRF